MISDHLEQFFKGENLHPWGFLPESDKNSTTNPLVYQSEQEGLKNTMQDKWAVTRDGGLTSFAFSLFNDWKG